METIKRIEIFGYFINGEVFSSDISLRFLQMFQKLKRTFRFPYSHIIYLNVSEEIEGQSEKDELNNLEYLIKGVLKGLSS